MSGFDPRRILRRRPDPPPPEPTLVDWVSAELAPPGAKIDDAIAARLDGLVGRRDARRYLRGRGPFQHFTVQRSIEERIRRAKRRLRRRQKRVERRVRP